ncbi:MAG: type II secretion system secretin GspD [Deltaproteobacteria bacterium]|nr:type II secretion system secretin GspD [Candidatus Tharpella aukensis]
MVSVNYKLWLRTGLVLFCSLFLLSCTMLRPSVREDALPPGGMLQGRPSPTQVNKAAEEGSEKEVLPAANEGDDLLHKLALQEQDFNQRLKPFSTGTVGSSTGSKAKIQRQIEGREMVSLNFDDADLIEVLRLFMEILEESYTIYQGVGGKVTLEVNAELNHDEIFELLRGVLRMNGAVMVERGPLWEIMPQAALPAAAEAGELLLPGDPEHARGKVIRAFRLRYLAGAQFVNIIKPYLSKGAQVYVHEPSGVLLISDYHHVLAKVARLMLLFDVSVLAGLEQKVYLLRYVNAEDMAKELEKLVGAYGLAPGKGVSFNASLSFLALPRVNMLLVLSRDAEALALVDEWVVELDQEVPILTQDSMAEDIFVHYIQNGVATDIVAVLEGLFSGAAKKDPVKAKDEVRPRPLGKTILDNQRQNQAAADKLKARRGGAVSGTLEGEVTFVVDETTNSILVRATGNDYRKIKPVIEKLDIYPKQVLIEVTIAEVKLDETNKLGIEWSYLMKGLGGSADGLLGIDSGLGLISGSGDTLIGSGMSFLVSNSNRFKAIVRALADENRVNILSAPQILASDGETAKIDVGEDVPTVTSSYRTTDSGSTAQTTDTTIQYRNVGIILNVTPHINDNGMVRMEINQEVSQLSNKTIEGINSPIFSQRVADTILSVGDGQTVVIGGLIQQSRSKGYSGVPWISRIPLLRYFVGYEGKEFHSVELMFFITPHVILHEEDSVFVSRPFLNRLEQVKKTYQ